MTGPMDAANDFLFGGGGGKSAKFEHPGDAIVGRVVSMKVVQQTDFKTKEPMFWKDGSPRNQLAIGLQTTIRDDADDDGVRMIYARFKLQDAIREACETARTKLEIGGELMVAYTGREANYSGDGEPPKLYTATYTPAAAVALSQPPAGQQVQQYVPPTAAARQPEVVNGQFQAAPPMTAAPYAQPIPPAPSQADQAAAIAAWQASQQPAAIAAPPGMDPAAFAAFLQFQAAQQAPAAPPAPPAWTPPPGMPPEVAAALQAMTDAERAALGQ